MDRIGLSILEQELAADAAVMAEAARLAAERLADEHPGHLSACGYELNRLYNVLEKSFERLCTAFENHFEKSGDYHERLLERVSLDLPGIRPRFVPADHRSPLRELKSFRHFFRHAYEATLRGDRLAELVGHARSVAAAFPDWSRRFCAAIRADLGH
ncbi:MAG: hypothetical protein FJ309_05475 [Planctomycetes bacterium]|nr:hypothetical protein [Planctomycetota bacterium]MBM4056795.1 hypothetical protein [Planctomycetota bacterium]